MVSESKVTVRYAETDQMGITHHSVYPIWYELARTDLIKKLGITYTQMEQSGVITPLVDLHCRYIGVSRYEDELIVKAWVQGLTAARIEFGYEVCRAGESKPINTGSTMHAWVDAKTFRPMNMKKRFPQWFEGIRQMMEENSKPCPKTY